MDNREFNALCEKGEWQDFPATLQPHQLKTVHQAAHGLIGITRLIHNSIMERDLNRGYALDPHTEGLLLSGMAVLSQVINDVCEDASFQEADEHNSNARCSVCTKGVTNA